jgi:hypothetical protein
MSETTLFVRFVFESPYINSFIHHYKALGFKNIIILFHEKFLLDTTYKNIVDKTTIDQDVNTVLKTLLNSQGYLDDTFIQDQNIILHPVNNYKNKMYPKFRCILPKNIDWLFVIDSDEFLIINNKFKNISELINHALSEHPNIQTIQFKWVWVTNCVHNKELNMSEIINNDDCYENTKIRSLVYNTKTLHRYNPGLSFGNHCGSNNKVYPKYLMTTYLKNNEDYRSHQHYLKRARINEETLGMIIHYRLRSFHNLIFKTLNKYGIKSKNAARNDGSFLKYFTHKKHSKVDTEKCFMRLYDFKLFEYEKRHINNVRSLKSIIAKNFNNCLNHTQNIVFIVNKNEEEYCYKWLASELRIDSKKIEILKHNINFYNDMFKDMKGLRKNKKLNFLVT